MKKILDVEDPVFTLCEKAKQGDADAQFSVGISYLEGLGVKKDVEEALKWVNKAAEQNFGMAQFALGKFYYLGVDADKDMDKEDPPFHLYSRPPQPHPVRAALSPVSPASPTAHLGTPPPGTKWQGHREQHRATEGQRPGPS